jgi:hypothetical protein
VPRFSHAPLILSAMPRQPAIFEAARGFRVIAPVRNGILRERPSFDGDACFFLLCFFF